MVLPREISDARGKGLGPLRGRTNRSSLKPFGLVRLRRVGHERIRDTRAGAPNHSLKADAPVGPSLVFGSRRSRGAALAQTLCTLENVSGLPQTNQVSSMRLSRLQKRELDRAKREMDEGDFSLGKKLIKPLAEAGIPEAVYLYACCIDAHSRMRGELRHIRELKRAALLGHPAAIYHLGMYHDVGVELPKNTYRASLLFRKAASLGHPRSMWIYALELLWGNGHPLKNEQLGLQYLEKACAKGFDEAYETRAKIYQEGLFGVEKNLELAAHNMRLAEECRA
jgi:TPR repeat protein